MIGKTALTVCSRTTGAASVKPEVCKTRTSALGVAGNSFLTNNLREDLVVDDLLRQVVDHNREVIEQADPECSIRISKESDNNWRKSRIELFLRQL